MNNTTDQVKLSFEGHVLITDMDTQEVILDKFNDINFENMAIAIAHLLANETDNADGYYITNMAFGYGGTVVDSNGNLSYKSPKVDGSLGALYTPSLVAGTEFEKAITAFSIPVADGQYYRDLISTVVLDYNEPTGQQDIDNATDFDTNDNFVFDEIALKGDNGLFLTHLIFHPIQKSSNRKLEVKYTLRIRVGS